MTAASVVQFGRSLSGAQNQALRERLASLWARTEWLLVVDSAIAMMDNLEREPPSEPSEATYLLFDWNALFLYRCPATDTNLPGLHSFVRYVVDVNSAESLGVLRTYWSGGSFRFNYSLESLDVLRYLWTCLLPGHVVVLNLGTAAIETVRLPPHPEDPMVRRSQAMGRFVPGAADVDLRTDESLRLRSAQRLVDAASEAASMARDRRLRWSRLSLPVASAVAAANGGRTRTTCFGKGVRCREAEAVACLEALERMHVGLRWPGDPLVYASYTDVCDRAIDPRTLCYERDAYDLPNGLDQYDDHVPMYWTEATHATRGDTMLVPAQEIWYGTDRLPGEHRFIRTTTNGFAIGSCREEAALFALFEAIERDAYLTMWYTRRPCRKIDLSTVDDERCQLLYERWRLCLPSYDLHLFDITTDCAVPTVAAIAVRPEGGPGPRTMHAAATRVTVTRAVLAALNDLSAMVPDAEPARVPQVRNLASRPDLVKRPWHHFLLYSLDETFSRLSFLPWQGRPVHADDVDGHALNLRSETYQASAVLERIVRHLGARGIDVYFKDATYPWLADGGLRCVKAIAPELFPIWFGPRNRRFRLSNRLRRLGRHYAGREFVQRSDFNLELHPFS